MACHRALSTFAAVIAVCLNLTAHAAGQSAPSPAQDQSKKMKMNEPMSTGMMKKGMTKGDVKRAAERKARALQPAMEQEQKSMPP